MAKDIYHDTVKTALEKDGWTITEELLRLTIGSRSVYIDLGAEKLIAAEKEGRKIAIEIKSFVSPSPVNDLENALGQYILYRDALKRSQPQRILYLAISDEVYLDFFQEEIAQMVIEEQKLKLIIFDANKAEVVKWIE
ncbi:MAG TPA: fatty-acid synthase [Cyanobacteria bacterium UBA11149]|nr:fatty-acid synthase [Cyanobacteria bacterium UBA11367]HBE56260.1 fatty-acid synthase [Cyanobacteria bacterium UBA11366]HBK64628.1 fatty-acid synthase [Cyanobacteria bacterium UBA11166]HBR76191.1 fatty-acid synthase [Cyanobacteria bacterium UBA11159]HBS68147.1 fatty-acid synthase [Cyanobacteria bacterium UBA11153]HBW91009.1 fatty-acid synthase [Cyanobacteria bacterium UBA11149]HCA95296.1 fatty-acid synthase [Cyanobacteria bacterium UBA9226]